MQCGPDDGVSLYLVSIIQFRNQINSPFPPPLSQLHPPPPLMCGVQYAILFAPDWHVQLICAIILPNLQYLSVRIKSATTEGTSTVRTEFFFISVGGWLVT